MIDATIVRTFLAPSFMAVIDRYNWWLPHRKRGPEAPPPSEIAADYLTTVTARRIAGSWYPSARPGKSFAYVRTGTIPYGVFA